MTLAALLMALRAGTTPAQRALLIGAYVEHAAARRRRRQRAAIASNNLVPEAYACR